MSDERGWHPLQENIASFFQLIAHSIDMQIIIILLIMKEEKAFLALQRTDGRIDGETNGRTDLHFFFKSSRHTVSNDI